MSKTAQNVFLCYIAIPGNFEVEHSSRQLSEQERRSEDKMGTQEECCPDIHGRA